jgi:hypothetical protein
MTEDSHCFSEEEDDMPQAPSPRVDRSRPNRSDVYQSSTQNADATTLRTLKVDDIVFLRSFGYAWRCCWSRITVGPESRQL